MIWYCSTDNDSKIRKSKIKEFNLSFQSLLSIKTDCFEISSQIKFSRQLFYCMYSQKMLKFMSVVVLYWCVMFSLKHFPWNSFLTRQKTMFKTADNNNILFPSFLVRLTMIYWENQLLLLLRFHVEPNTMDLKREKKICDKSVVIMLFMLKYSELSLYDEKEKKTTLIVRHPYYLQYLILFFSYYSRMPLHYTNKNRRKRNKSPQCKPHWRNLPRHAMSRQKFVKKTTKLFILRVDSNEEWKERKDLSTRW